VKKVYSSHHVIPRSRQRKGMVVEKVVDLPKLFHASWHVLFLNLHGKEIEDFIKIINKRMESQETITPKEITELRESLKKGR
jgi:hypothetical protein